MSDAAPQNATETQFAWLALTMTPQMGPTRSRRLVERLGSAEAVFRASLTELEACGIPAPAAQGLALGASKQSAEQELARAAAAGVELLCLDDPDYPEPLKNIYDPPVILYIRGNRGTLNAPGIAVVGTRHPTPYGLGMAERLACDLTARGLILFSGLARGVDSAAHRGAVNARGQTVGVLGTGVDVIYPRENKKLAEQMLSLGGALISEFPLGTAPTPQNFPIRNRIISGLSVGVLVVEAGEYSGTRITARCALEQCREVFAVPGNVTNRLSWGPNTLIKQGAKLVATWEDVWEELPSQLRLRLQPSGDVAASSKPETASLFPGQPELSPNERKVFSLIKSDTASHIDELVERLEPDLSASQIFAALFELELAGRIRQMPGKNFVRAF
ncbi:MAG: DNA-processing protein DprA [Terriglobia bacterium]|jgi:DNA processing protein|nr:DNA-processing protein DprA [Terriglobia bacterium]